MNEVLSLITVEGRVCCKKCGTPAHPEAEWRRMHLLSLEHRMGIDKKDMSETKAPLELPIECLDEFSVHGKRFYKLPMLICATCNKLTPVKIVHDPDKILIEEHCNC